MKKKYAASVSKGIENPPVSFVGFSFLLGIAASFMCCDARLTLRRAREIDIGLGNVSNLSFDNSNVPTATTSSPENLFDVVGEVGTTTAEGNYNVVCITSDFRGVCK